MVKTRGGGSGKGAVSAPSGGHYRWVICALLFFATTINYVDRQVIGILAPTLKRELGWTEIEFSNIVVAFQLAYAIGLLIAGRLMDWLGTRLGLALSLAFWSVAAAGHAFVKTVFGFSVARFALGLGEAGNFPAAIKTVAEWFPKRERALATGIFNAGSNVGAVLAPLAVPWITIKYGWPMAFLATGLIGFVWLLFWIPLYRRPEEHPKLSKAELAYIHSDPQEPVKKIHWLELFRHRQTWAFFLGKFLTDPVWWFYLYWAASFLDKNFGLSLGQLGLPLIVIYLAADVGSIGGGWLPMLFLKRGWSVNAARKTAMLICALCVVPVTFAATTSSLWVAVGLIGLAAAAHQGWSANLFTLSSDLFPKHAVGSIVGIGGMAGAVGGILISKTIGYVLQWTGSNYLLIFVFASSAYLLALGVVQLLSPQLKPAVLSEKRG